MPGRLQGGQFVEHVIMAVPARLETVVDKLGVMTSDDARCEAGQVCPPLRPETGSAAVAVRRGGLCISRASRIGASGNSPR